MPFPLPDRHHEIPVELMDELKSNFSAAVAMPTGQLH
jgi:hypothetical protein